MFTLRLTQHAEAEADHYRVEVALEGDGARQIANARFPFKLSEQDQEALRWYLEDYLQHPFEPESQIAARVEQRLRDVGIDLFKAVFQADDDARDLWAAFRDKLDETRVEIVTDVRTAASIPWELLRDPKTDAPLALRARAFVRAQPQAAQRPALPHTEGGPIRILLVICRPGGSDDVPFRSVASKLIKGLSEEARARFQLDVLRPPTFEQLGKALRAAKAKGEPYHVVHFDGHGVYAEIEDASALGGLLKGLSPLLLAGHRAGPHGYLAFENSKMTDNVEFVDGGSLGKLLVETHTPVLVLNACRSAHAEPAPTPTPEKDPPLPSGDVSPEAKRSGEGTGVRSDPHSQVRAFGSLAQEVMDAGVAGVVAMRYNVYVVTAAQFVADLYAALAQGQALGEAVTLGRKQLQAQPLREIAYAERPLQDWPVPIVYEAAPIKLFPPIEAHASLQISPSSSFIPHPSSLNLPPSPDIGFFGRDETLLALDRAFDTQRIVLLHAFAGSGKTTTAAEFARWYALTGGLDGPVLFTSFEQYKPLARVLDTIEQAFGAALEQNGIHWLALTDDTRREVALQVLAQIPVLWIWDNVEPVKGFPRGTASAWSATEQKELADFLRAARETKAKFLLTSRRDEHAWLGDLPARIAVPPMPMQERVQLARALAEKHGRRITDVKDWRPLLYFTQGNPLTITVLVGELLREWNRQGQEGSIRKEVIEAFVEKLRAGEAAFEDEVSEGRSKSLGASLSYGFQNAFTEPERKQLALLHFFQGFVDVNALREMGHPKAPWCLPEVRGLTREAGTALLDHAAEIGLLTAYGGGYYSIHPALPWYFKSLFDEYYLTEDGGRLTDEEPPSSVVRPPSALFAFVSAIGELGNYYHDQYGIGNREVIAALTAEEANLLHTRQLARANGWWVAVISAMQGLQTLYEYTGRLTEWARLVYEIVPDFFDPATDSPLPGREDLWGLMIEYRVLLKKEARQWTEAERLQRIRMAWERQRAAPTIAMPLQSLDNSQRNAIRALAISAEALGTILCEQGKPECVVAYKEAIALCQHIKDKHEEAIIAFNLGHSYKEIITLRDLEQAEHWYRHSLELRDERDQLGQGRGHYALGHVAYEHFREAKAAKQTKSELIQYLNAALQFYQQALALLPSDAVYDLAVTHNQIGNIYNDVGDLDHSLLHYRECIRCDEAAGNTYGAAQTRFNVAIALGNAGRQADALAYAREALRNFETYGEGAAEEIGRTRRLIEAIEGT